LKIRCLRFECEVCNKIASIQVFYNKSGAVKYARSRHYLSMINGKPQFQYHQQSLEYIERKLNEMPKEENSSFINSGHIEQVLNVDPNKIRNSSNLENTCGRSLAWLGHQVPNLTTRVQIPVTAPLSFCFVPLRNRP
jgi:hypothetical protein